MAKTPDEIKKGIVEAIEEVSWVVEGGDAHDLQDACDKAHASMADALALIEQLELQNALLTAEKYLNNEFRNRIKKAQFATLINLMGGESPKEHYAIVKNNIAYKLAEFLLKEGAIVFCEVYSNHCEMEEIVGTIEIVMPEPPKEE